MKISIPLFTLFLAACTVAAPPAGRSVPAARSLAESQPTPVVSAQPALGGVLWVDAAMGALWRFDLAAGTSERVPMPSDAHPAQPALTPDCAVQAWLVAAPGSDRYGVAVGAAFVLTPTDAVAYGDVALAPDGRALFATRILSSGAGVDVEIVRLALDAGGSPQLVVAAAAQPSVSPNGARLAYVAQDAARPPEILQQLRVRSIGGSGGSDEVAVLEDGRFFEIFGPRWLDDEHIAFAALERSPADEALTPLDVLLGRASAHARPPAHARAGYLWVVNADGSGLRRLTDVMFEAPILAPSPDGRYIALLAEDAVHVMNADGSGLRMLAEVGGSGGLAWCRS